MLALLVLPMLLSTSYEKKKDDSFNLYVLITNIRNSNGRIQLQVFRNQDEFSTRAKFRQYYVDKKKMKDGKVPLKITDLPKGVYGLALLDDENKDGDMDYRLLVPTEGFGFSNYYHTGLKKPKFDKFKFNLDSDKKILMRVRYM